MIQKAIALLGVAALASAAALPVAVPADAGQGGTIVVAAGCGACHPCAAKMCNPCNPCAANMCHPCNPCAAKSCDPCNPCAAKSCNPRNPCGTW